MATAVLVLGALDLAYRNRRPGIMVGLAVVPAIGLLLPASGSRRWLRFLPGIMALVVALLLSMAEWRSRPFVVLFTLFDVVALTWVVGRLTRAQDDKCAADGSGRPQAAVRPDPAVERGVWRINDLRGEFCRLVPDAGGWTSGDFHDVRVCAFGTRLLMVDLQGAATGSAAAAALLHHWRSLASTEPSLAEIARRLDIVFSEHGGNHAKALLINIDDTGDAVDLVCCGRQPPYVLGEQSVIPVSVLAQAPALGGIAAPDAGPPLYVTRVRFPPGGRLLLVTDALTASWGALDEPFPTAVRAMSLDGCDSGTLLERLAEGVRVHVGAAAPPSGTLLLVENDDTLRPASVVCGARSPGAVA
ncbi:SpoIIE family protein phosphatase [Streptomyces alboflavus]|uniref:SpoIIE family protein phosphatase n=1 Tax=Streptomyces alboflavus TaxID=67267 RepID=UPI0036CA0F81